MEEIGTTVKKELEHLTEKIDPQEVPKRDLRSEDFGELFPAQGRAVNGNRKFSIAHIAKKLKKRKV